MDVFPESYHQIEESAAADWNATANSTAAQSANASFSAGVVSFQIYGIIVLIILLFFFALFAYYEFRYNTLKRQMKSVLALPLHQGETQGGGIDVNTNVEINLASIPRAHVREGADTPPRYEDAAQRDSSADTLVNGGRPDTRA